MLAGNKILLKSIKITKKKYIFILVSSILLAVFFVSVLYFAKPIFISWREHDARWRGEHDAILQFAGCNFDKKLITSSDEYFSTTWKDSIKQYGFNFDDVARNMSFCLESRKDHLKKAIEYAENQPAPLTDEQIEEKVKQQLAETSVATNQGMRKLTEEEKEKEAESIRNSFENPVSAYATPDEEEKDVTLLNAYQQKFLNREFSVLKNK